MECTECKTWEEDLYWDHFNSFHFLLPLPPNFRHTLALPEKFASHMKARLPNKVSLKGPSGASWEIELQKSNDLLLVGNGWKDFVKAHNLNENCLLMFNCEKYSIFKVLIFDKGSLCEREASYFIKKCNHTKSAHEDQRMNGRQISSNEIIENDEEDSVIFLSEKRIPDDGPEACSGGKVSTQNPRKCELFPTARNGMDNLEDMSKRRKHVESVACNVRKRNIQTARQRVHYSVVRVRDTLKRGPSPFKSSIKREAICTSTEKQKLKEDMSNSRKVTEMEKADALQRATQEETETSFTVVMRPSAVSKLSNRFNMCVPADWLRKHPLCAMQKVVLRIGEKTWATTFSPYAHRSVGGQLVGGWKRFALANTLEEFDVLVFTPVSQKEEEATIVMDVAIFRVVS